MDKTIKIKELVKKLNKYRESYYNGSPEIPDEQFDFEEQTLREMDPNNEYFSQIGAKPLTRDVKVEHEIPMLSMQKVQKAEDAVKWYFDIIKINGLHFDNIINPGVWIDPKLDGISGKVVYDNNGNYSYASTRGNGKVGAKILFGDKITSIPKQFLPNSELRGEFIINKKYRKKFDGPLRNICSGILKRKEYTEDVDYVSFVIYDAFTYSKSNEIQFINRKDKIDKIDKLLTNFGNKDFEIIPIEKTVDITNMYDRYIKVLRDKWEYETDGMIMTIDGGQDNYNIINSHFKIDSCNRYNMAIKPPALFASSVVRDIKAYVNRMKISFVAEIEPVIIGDITCSAATLNNYTDMMEKKIGIGTNVLVNRANDVIPKIVESYNEEGKVIKYLDIKRCPCCGSPVEKYNRDLVCMNEYGCVGVYESKLLHLLEVFEVKNIGPSIIHEISKAFFKDKLELTFRLFIKLCLMEGKNSIDKYLEPIIGIDTGRYKIFRNSIKYLFDNATELKLLSGFNIPFIGVSELTKHGIRTVKEFFDYCDNLKKSSVISSSFDNLLLRWISDKKHVDDLKECYDIMKSFMKSNTVEVPEGSVSYCISGEIPGKTKSEVIDDAKKINNKFIYTKNFSAMTKILVSNETGTTKVIKAKRYNIPVLTYDQFISYIKGYK